MTTPQADSLISVWLPNYESGLQFLVEHVKINRYVRDLESANKHITFTRPKARDCWLRTLDLEYKMLMDESTVDSGEIHEASMQLYQKGIGQVDTVQWLVKLEQDPAIAAESDGPSQMLNHRTNVAGEAANLSERMNDLITAISNDSGTGGDDYNISNSKQLNSKHLDRQIARRARQEKYRNLQTANEMLEILATIFYHSGLQDLEAQWLGPVPSEAVEKYKKTCMERARDLFKEHAKPEAKRKHGTALEVSIDIDSDIGRDEVGVPSVDEVWEAEDQTIEANDLPNINLHKPFIDANKPIDPTMESIERAALEMHRLQYVRNKQQLKGPRSWYSGLLNFARVREALRFKMSVELDRQVSKAEASAELNKMMSAQAKIFKMMRKDHKRRSKETSVEPKVKAATKKQRRRAERKRGSKQRREAKLQKRKKREDNLSATGPNDSSHHAPSSQAHPGTHNLLQLTRGADIDMDTALVDEMGFDLLVHKPAFKALQPSPGRSLQRNASPMPPTQMKQEVKQEDDEGISSMEFEVRVGIDRMLLQE